MSVAEDGAAQGGPTAMEIAEFSRYLGMDPAMDSNLLWIAEEALCSPLPENWEEAVRKDGTPYYYNKKENKSTNKHPLEDFYRSLYNEMKEIQNVQQQDSDAAPQLGNRQLSGQLLVAAVRARDRALLAQRLSS